MAISTTYLVLQQQIADELGDRTDLLSPLSDSGLALSPIKNAIQSAIAKWEREPFYFNETYSQDLFSTVAGQEFYTTTAAAIIATSPYILKMHILISNNRYPLEVRTWQYLEDISANPNVTGYPVDVAYFDEQLRFYPIPDGAYPVTLSEISLATALVEDADSNIWTADGFDLIRSEAKRILAEEVLHDDTTAARMKRAIYGDPAVPKDKGYFGALKAETMRRARSRIRPTYFTPIIAAGLSSLLYHLL